MFEYGQGSHIRRLKAAKRSRKPAASDPTRDKLLDVAGRIFADRGLPGRHHPPDLRRRRCQCSAVNYHFGDKLGLYTEVVRQSARLAEFQAAQTIIDRDAPRKRSSGLSSAPVFIACSGGPARLELPDNGP